MPFIFEVTNYAAEGSTDGADLTIYCGGKAFCVHKNVITACEYFEGAITAQSQEGENSAITLSDAEPVAVNVILDHLYGRPYPSTQALGQMTIYLHISVYLIGESYGVQSLKNAAMDKIKDYLPTTWSLESSNNSLFWTTLIIIYKKVPRSNQQLLRFTTMFLVYIVWHIMNDQQDVSYTFIEHQCPEMIEAIDEMILIPISEYGQFSDYNTSEMDLILAIHDANYGNNDDDSASEMDDI